MSLKIVFIGGMFFNLKYYNPYKVLQEMLKKGVGLS